MFFEKKPSTDSFSFKKKEQGVTTTHIFESLIRMLKSVDPDVAHRRKLAFLRKMKQRPSHSASRTLGGYYKTINQNSYKHFVSTTFYRSRTASYTIKHEYLFYFISTLSPKKYEYDYQSNLLFNSSLKNNSVPFNVVEKHFLCLLASRLSTLLSSHTCIQFNTHFLVGVNNGRVLYFRWMLWHFKIKNCNTPIVFDNNTEEVSSYREKKKYKSFQKIFFFLKNLRDWRIQILGKLRLSGDKTRYIPLFKYISLPKYACMNTTFFTTSQFNFLKILVSNVERLVLLSKYEFPTSLYSLSHNSFIPTAEKQLYTDESGFLLLKKIINAFDVITTSYILYSDNQLYSKSRVLKCNTKELLSNYYLWYGRSSFRRQLNRYTSFSSSQLSTYGNIYLTKELYKVLSSIKSNVSASDFIRSASLNRISNMVNDVIFATHLERYSTDRVSKNNVFNKVTNKLLLNSSGYFTTFLSKASDISSDQVDINLLRVLNIIKSMNSHSKKSIKEHRWLPRWVAYKFNKLKKDTWTKSIPITKLVARKAKKNYFFKLRNSLQRESSTLKKTMVSKILMDKIVLQSSKSKCLINKSKDYSFLYLVFIDKNKLLKLFRNFLIKHGLKRKANGWFVKILQFLKHNYKICPLRTLRFLIMRHYQASLIKERKLKKKVIFVPKRLSIRKQLFYMVFFFFKEVQNFNISYKEQFSYVKDTDNRIVHSVKNYVRYAMDYGTIFTSVTKKTKTIEEKMYSLKHFLKKKGGMSVDYRFKKKKKHSLYKGHTNVNL